MLKNSISVMWILAFMNGSCRTSSSAETMDIGTNVNSYGTRRGLLFDHLYYIQRSGTTFEVVRGICRGEVSLLHCQEGIERTKVPLNEFLDAYYPNLSRSIWELIEVESSNYAYLTSLNHFQDRISVSNEDSKATATEQAFIRSVSRRIEPKFVEGTIQRYMDEFSGILTLLNMLTDPTQTHVIRTDNLHELDKKFASALQVLSNKFEAAQRAVGVGCRISSDSGRFRYSGGGCLDTSTDLVWGPSETGSGHFTQDFWSYPEAASAWCEQRTYGKRYNWRLPTKAEFASIRGMQELLPIDRGPYYWTSDIGSRQTVVTKDFSLPDEVIQKSSHTILLGFDTDKSADQSSSQRFSDYFDWSRGDRRTSGGGYTVSNGQHNSQPVYGTDTGVTTAIDRVLTGSFRVTVTERYVFNPWNSDDKQTISLTQHELISADGTLSQKIKRERSTPVAGTTTSHSHYSEKNGFDYAHSGVSYGAYIDSRSRQESESSRQRSTSRVNIYGYDKQWNISPSQQSVNPLRFISFSASDLDVSRKRIGVVCVRENSEIMPPNSKGQP